MPSIPIHISSDSTTTSKPSPLPQLLQTPNGLAIVEIQGTLNLPQHDADEASECRDTDIGRLVFPNLGTGPDSATEDGAREDAWMKKVYFYVGKNQRLVGEVKKLPRPFGVLRRREGGEHDAAAGKEDLEIVDVVNWKIFFGGRPEFV